LNTPKRQSAEAIVRRVWKLLEVEGEVMSIEPYWKDPTVMQACLTTPLVAVDIEAATFQLLTAAARVTHGVHTSGPQQYDNGDFEMTVLSTAGFADSGLTWMEASVRSFG